MTESGPSTDERDLHPAEDTPPPDLGDDTPGNDGVEGGGGQEGPTPDDAGDPAASPAKSPVADADDGQRADYDRLNDRHLRLAAEFNNYRRRVEQERLDAWGRAQADLVGRFLDVLDDLQRVAGLDLSNATVETIMEGIDLVERKFVRMLEDAGAEALNPEGERFDPERMEAMMKVPAESEDADEMVADVFQKGYAFKGQLVRPARVTVYKFED